MQATTHHRRRLFIILGLVTLFGSLSLFSGVASKKEASRPNQPQLSAPNVKPRNSQRTARLFGPRLAAAPKHDFDWRNAASWSASAFFAPMISATKSAALQTDLNSNTFVNPGDTLGYSVLVSNSAAPGAGNDATGVALSDTLDSNLTLVGGSVAASAVAVNDTFPVTVVGNVSIDSSAIASPFSVLTNDYLGLNTTATIAAFDSTSANGGNVTMTTSGPNAGMFTYNPPAGFEGTDTFTYTLSDNPNAPIAAPNRTGTVSITVSGMVWFINNNAASCTTAGCGRLSNPFSTLAAFNALNDGTGLHPASNDNIFVYESATDYSGAVTLLSGQKLIGQDATASLSAITGLTPPLGSPSFPVMNSANGTITNITSTVTINTNALVRGLSINSTTSTGMNDPAGAITGVSVSEVNVTTTTGTAVLLSSAGGTFSFIKIAANGAATGIDLSNTTGSFTVTGTGGSCTAATPTCTGGTISNVTDTGIKLSNVNNVSLTRMRLQNSTNFGLNGSTVNTMNIDTCLFDGTHGGAIDEGAIFVTNWFGSGTINNSDITGGFNDNVRVNNTAAGTLNRLTVSSTTIRNSGNNHGLAFYGCLNGAAGTCPATTMNMTVSNSTFTDNSSNSVNVSFASTTTGDIVLQNNQFVSTSLATVGGPGGSVLLAIDHSSDMTLDVNGNTFTNPRLSALTAFVSNQTAAAASMVGKIRNNTIGTNAVALSGSRQGSGMQVTATGAATVTLDITGNTVLNWATNNGIDISAGDGGATGPQVNLGITSNTVRLDSPTVNQLHGISLNLGTTSTGGAVTACADIGGAGALANNLNGASSAPGGGSDIRFRQRNAANVRLPGFGGPDNNGTTSAAAAVTYLNGRNNITSGVGASGTVNAPTGGTFTGGVACTAPPAPPPMDENPIAAPQERSGANSASMIGRLQNWLRPVYTAFSAARSYVSLNHLFTSAVAAIAPTAAAAEYENAVAPAALSAPSGAAHSAPPSSLASFAGETITVSGITLPAGKSVNITFDATISSSYTSTTITNQATISGSNFSNVLSNNLSTPVIQPPNFSKAFSPATIATNTGVSTLTFTLVNPNPAQALSGVAFTDPFPAGVEVAATPAATTSGCGAPTFTPAAAATSINFSGGSIAAGGTCTVNVNVRGTTEGVKANLSSTATSTQANPSSTATANLTVMNAPTFSKAFGAPTIPLNGTTSLTFTITNASAFFQLNGIGFTDTLPAGLVVATPNNLSTTCGGTPSAPEGGSMVSLSGATRNATTSCTLTVNVTGTTAGAKNNSATLATTELGANSAATGTVTLTVLAPPTIAKGFSPTSVAVGGASSVLTFTISNPNASGTLTGVGFSDNFPSGVEVASSPGVAVSNCGVSTNTSSFTAGATSLTVSNAAVTVGTPCTISVNVIGTTAGAKNNTTGAITSTEGGTGTTSNTATLNVFTAPQITKSFGASAIPVNGTTTLTFTITNPAANPGALSTITFIDSLPAGMVVVNPPVPTNTCGGSVTAVSGSGTISLGGASIATPGSTCQVQATVQGTTAGVKNNSVTVSSGNGGTGNTANASITVANPPTVSKAFSPSLITPGGTSTLTVTLTNPNASVDLTSAAVTDTLPSGVTTMGGTAATTCGGTASQTGNSVSLSGGTIPQGGSCTLSVNVTSATNNVYTNTIAAGAVTTNVGSNASPASATLTVADPPTLSKAFSPNQITSGGTSTLTITLGNPNSNVPLTLSSPLTDTLPLGVTTVAATAATTCSGGVASQAAGSVTLTGGTIPVGGSCTLSVNVTSTNAGANNNTIAAGALVTNGGVNANPATATLVVGSAPAVTKSFSPTTIKTNATTTMTIAIANNNPTLPFNGVAFTDTMPAGLTVPDAAASTQCGGTLTVASNVITFTGGTVAANSTCTLTFTATGATTGVKNNSVTVNTSNFGTGAGSATVTVYDPPTIVKSFLPTSVPFGDTSTMSFVLTNPNTFAGGNLTGLSFSDSLNAGVVVATGSASVCGGTLTMTAPSNVSFSGGTLGIAGPGNTCTINVTVTGAAVGVWNNTTSVLSSTEVTGATSNTATFTVTQSPTATIITNAGTLGSTPTVVGQSYAVNVTVMAVAGMGTPSGTVLVSDNTGATCTVTLSGGSGTCNLTSTTVGAPKAISATYQGDTNFVSSTASASHTVNKANTTLSSLTDSPDPTVVGQPYTVGFTLSVTAPGAGTPTGTVTVTDGTGGTCTATLPATSCSLTSTSQGAKTLTFTYNGDANFNTSTNTTGHQVNKADTTTTITSDNPDPSVVGQSYTVVASLTVNSPGAGTPTGLITVSDGFAMCTITLPATSCSLISSTPGAKTLTATYGGDANFNGSSDTENHQVNKADTTTTITADTPDPTVIGQPYTVTASVAVNSPGAGTPTGTIVVSDGATTCAITLPGTTCSLPSTSAGVKTLTATYSGDTNFNTSTSAGVPHTVNKADTTTVISSDLPDPSVVGQNVVVNYSVTVNAPGVGAPTGNVTVSDGVNTCIGTVAAGTCTLALTTVGARTLTATYAGDALFNTSSGTAAHTVNQATTTTTITSDNPDPSVVGQVVVVNYTVTVNAPGAGTPTGNVTVTDGVNTCTGTVAAGTCSLALTTVGARTLTATYPGTAQFAGSSGTNAHTVNKANTTTTITSHLPDPSSVNQNVVVNYTVVAAAPGAGTPTGNVTVSDGVNSCTGTVAAGTCTLALSTSGVRTLTATYAGDAQFNSSVSAGQQHTVASPPNVSTTLGSTNIFQNTTTVLTVTVTNPNAIALTSVAFSATLPAGLVIDTSVAARPGSNTCSGTFTAVNGSGSLSLTTGVVAPNSSCAVAVGIRGTTPGVKTINVSPVTTSQSGPSAATTATLTVHAGSITIGDPITCLGAGSTVEVVATVTNNSAGSLPVTWTSVPSANLLALGGSCTANAGSCTVTNSALVSWSGTLSAGQTVTIRYQAQVTDDVAAQVCTTSNASFNSSPVTTLQYCTNLTCPREVGLPYPANSATSDQKPGSVLVWNYYTSSSSASNHENTRISITNTDLSRSALVHLFFVDGASCSVADSFICLTPNQTTAWLMSDLDPGVSGYVIAVAVDAGGCPTSFNRLIGDEFIKTATGHQANLMAQAFAALPGAPVSCDSNATSAILRFDGTMYNRAPRVLALSSLMSPSDGSSALLVVNRLGGSLINNASTVGTLFGLLYDDVEKAYSFNVTAATCQLRQIISNNFPRTTPRLGTVIPSGRTGWMKVYSNDDVGLLGAVLQTSSPTNAGLTGMGRNLHTLTHTGNATLTIPVFAPTCR